MNRYVRPISLRPTRDEFAISSRVLGTLHCLHAAYRDAATTPSIDRPRIKFLFTALRYTIAAVSRTFRRVAHANPPLPLPEAIQLRPVPRRDRLAVRVLVLPPDRRREAFVVDRVGHRCARAGPLLALFDVEGPPFWPLVDHLVRQDEAAFLTDELAALVIERQVARVALGASSDFFGFFDLLCRHGLPQQRTRRLQSTTARRPRRAVRPRRARGQVRRP